MTVYVVTGDFSNITEGGCVAVCSSKEKAREVVRKLAKSVGKENSLTKNGELETLSNSWYITEHELDEMEGWEA